MYSVTYMLIILTILFVVTAQQLKPHNSFSSAVLPGTKLSGGTLLKIVVENFQSCVQECLVRKRCKSLNFITQVKLCELNYKSNGDNDAILSIATGCWYSEVSYWNAVSSVKLLNNS